MIALATGFMWLGVLLALWAGLGLAVTVSNRIAEGLAWLLDAAVCLALATLYPLGNEPPDDC